MLSAATAAQSPLQQAADLARHGHYAAARQLVEGVPEPAELPQRIAFHRLRAAIASGLHEPGRAVTEMKAALALAPSDPNILLALAVAELQAENAAGYTEDAIRSLEAAIAVDPKLNAPYAALAKIVLQSSAPPPARTTRDLCSWSGVVCSALELRHARETGDQKLEAKAISQLKLAPASSAIGRCELARGYEWTGRLAEARTEIGTLCSP